MLWFLVWTVLVLAAVAVLARLGWSVFRRGTALVREMGEAAEMLGRAAEQAERLSAPKTPAEADVFNDPHQLRRDNGARRGARRPRRVGMHGRT